MKNIALRLRYDGSRYHGWQIQKNEISVAQTVEEALEKVLGTRTKIVGCGRTDAGVHALRYCANFHAETNIPMERMPLAVNSRLPDDIAVTDAVEVEENFNAIGSCIKKEYIYKIHNSNIRDPFLKDRVCFYPQRLDMEQFSRAAAAFEGTHDFKAVRSVGTETKTTVRTVYWCRAEREGDIITVSICADGFLYNMVRIMVGTLLDMAQGRRDFGGIPRILASRDRGQAGRTAPAAGLTLERVFYPAPWDRLGLNGDDSPGGFI